MLHNPSPFNLSPISKLPNIECTSGFFTPSSKALPLLPKSAKSDRSTLSKLLFAARTNKKLQNQTQNFQVNQAKKSPTTEFLDKLNQDIRSLHGKFQRFDEHTMTIEQEYTEMKRFCQLNDILDVNQKAKALTAMPEELPLESVDPTKSYYKEYQDAIKLSQDMHTEFTRFMVTTDTTISKFLSQLDHIFKNNVQRMSIHETLSFVENYTNHMQADIWAALARVTRFPNVLIQLHMEVRDLLGLDDAFKEELRRKDKKIMEEQLAVSQQEILQLKEDFAVSLEKDSQCQKDLEEEKKEIRRLINMYGEVVKMKKEEESLKVYEADKEEENEWNEEEEEVNDEGERRDESCLKRILLKKVKVEMDELKKGLQRDYSTDCLEISASHWKEGTRELEDQLKELKSMRKELKKSCGKTEEIVENSQKERVQEKEDEEKEIVFLKMNHEKGVFETDEDNGGIKERPLNILEEHVNEKRSSRVLEKRIDRMKRTLDGGKENQFQFANSVLRKRSLKFLEDEVEGHMISPIRMKKNCLSVMKDKLNKLEE